MAASKDEIREWFLRGVKAGARYMLVVCDTFDHDDYPSFVKPGVDVKAVVAGRNGHEMQRVMEVYDLTKDMDAQLAEFRAWNVGP